MDWVDRKLDIVGETEIRVDNASFLPVLVTRNSPHSLLLSSDAIAKGNGIIDYEKNGMIGMDKNTHFWNIQARPCSLDR